MPLPFDIPEYERFVTVDELTKRIERLAAAHPNRTQLRTIGRSTDGEPIRMLRIGDAHRQLLFVGCPHPNEPIGMLTIDRLAHALAHDEVPCGDFTWNFILCADPDGARLNEGWFSGPFTLTDYARDFYRPPFDDQAILTFPFRAGAYTYLRPIPETQALMTAISALRPVFVSSLHNAALGGGYFYLSPYPEGMGKPLRHLLHERSIPLAMGEPELAWGIEPSPAIFECTTMAAHVAFLRGSGDPTPEAGLSAGETTYGFSRSICDPLFLICEVPYFADLRIGDERASGTLRLDSVRKGIERSEEIISFGVESLRRMSGRWSGESRLRCAAEAVLPQADAGLKAHLRWANDAPELKGTATIAQDFSNRWETPFYHALSLGVLRRALASDVSRGSSSQARAVLRDVESRMDEWMAGFEEAINYRVVPIRDLVEVQLASALLCIEQL